MNLQRKLLWAVWLVPLDVAARGGHRYGPGVSISELLFGLIFVIGVAVGWHRFKEWNPKETTARGVWEAAWKVGLVVAVLLVLARAASTSSRHW